MDLINSVKNVFIISLTFKAVSVVNTYILPATFNNSDVDISANFNFSISVLAVCFAFPAAHPKYPLNIEIV